MGSPPSLAFHRKSRPRPIDAGQKIATSASRSRKVPIICSSLKLLRRICPSPLRVTDSTTYHILGIFRYGWFASPSIERAPMVSAHISTATGTPLNLLEQEMDLMHVELMRFAAVFDRPILD